MTIPLTNLPDDIRERAAVYARAIMERDRTIVNLLGALEAAHHMLTRDYIDDAKRAVIEKCEAAIARAKG